METPIKMLTKEEKENVLLVLNEFSEEYKANTKSVNALITTVKEFTGIIDHFVEKIENQQPAAESTEASKLNEVIETVIEKINTAAQNITFSENELKQLSAKLDRNAFLLQNPTPQKIAHHHQIPKIIWIAAGLFLSLVLACTGWYITTGKLDDYKTGDIKYRYLKQKSNPVLFQLLYTLDSLQLSEYAMKDSVILWEREEKKAFELNRKLQLKSEEGEELKGKLEALEKQNKRRKGTK